MCNLASVGWISPIFFIQYAYENLCSMNIALNTQQGGIAILYLEKYSLSGPQSTDAISKVRFVELLTSFM